MQEPCQKASGFVFCSMHAEEREKRRLFWEGIGKICTTKSELPLNYQRHPYLSPGCSEEFYPTTEDSNRDSASA